MVCLVIEIVEMIRRSASVGQPIVCLGLAQPASSCILQRPMYVFLEVHTIAYSKTRKIVTNGAGHTS